MVRSITGIPDVVMNMFGPKDVIEERIYAEEWYRIDVQMTLFRLMSQHNVTVEDIAARLGEPVEWVEQVFDDDYELTVRKLGALLYAIRGNETEPVSEPAGMVEVA